VFIERLRVHLGAERLTEYTQHRLRTLRIDEMPGGDPHQACRIEQGVLAGVHG